MKPSRPQTGLSGSRIVLSVDEPTVFPQQGDEIRKGTIDRVLTLRNDLGDPYEVAFARLERPLSYGVHSSATVSLMTRYAKDVLSDMLSREFVIVNIGLEESWVLETNQTDPRFRDRSRGFYLGFGTVALDRPG